MIGYYAHHHGMGHLTRMQAISGHLDCPVSGLSSQPAPPAWRGSWVHLARDDTAPGDGQRRPAPVDETASGTLHWVPRHHRGLARRTAQIAEWAATTSPALMVADVSVEAALTARLCGVPVVVVAMPGRRDDRAHRLAYDAAEALLVPWPWEAHSQAWPKRWLDKAWFVGGFSRFDGQASPQLGAVPTRTNPRLERRALVLWGSGGRSTSLADVAAAQQATPGWRWTVRAPGGLAARHLWRELCAADVVVTHGGQNAVAEVAAAQRPAVVVAEPRPFHEQEETVAALHGMGVAVGLTSWPQPGAWPDLLDRAVELGADGWARWSSGRGAEVAAQHLDRLATALGAGGQLWHG